MRGLCLLPVFLLIFSCSDKFEEIIRPQLYGSIELKSKIPQMNSSSKIPSCYSVDDPEPDGSGELVRMLMRNENNVEWIVDFTGGVWEEGDYFYSAYSGPIPVGLYTVYDASFISGGIKRFSVPDLAESELLSQFTSLSVPFYLDIKEGPNNALDINLFCFQDSSDTILSESGELNGFRLKLRNLEVFLTDAQRECIDKIRVSFESGFGEPIGWAFSPVDYPIATDSPITVIQGVDAQIITVALVIDGEVVSQKDFGDINSPFNWNEPLTFDFECN